MTGKPMLSVERELLERAVNGHRHEHKEAMAELREMLRALPGKPAGQQLKEAYQAGFYEGQNNPNGYVCTKEMANALLAIAQGQEDE